MPNARSPLPDLLSYLQAQTDVTRSTLQRVLKTSGRLEEFLSNLHEFMDATVSALRTAMLELLIDGIQYERILQTENDHVWQQEQVFEKLTDIDVIAAGRVSNSIYEWVPVDLKIEREFAQGMNNMRATFKLPRSFTMRTSVGEYRLDWAIVKQENDMVYLIRETKAKLKIPEAPHIRDVQSALWGKHFKALGLSFEVVEKVEEV